MPRRRTALAAAATEQDSPRAAAGPVAALPGRASVAAPIPRPRPRVHRPPPRPLPLSPRPAIAVLVVLAAVAAFAVQVAHFWFVCDDAYIAFTYARNLAAGHGLVWHPGSEPVEGFSDPLWVLLMAAVCRMGLDPVDVAPWISAATGLWLMLWVPALLRRRHGDVAAAGALLLLATLPAFALWSTSGLETMPTALATFAVFALLLAGPERVRPVAAALWAAALALLRPEGLPLVGLWLLLGGALWRRGRNAAPTAVHVGRALLLVAVAALLASAAWLAFRLGWFGDWVSNTARAKGGFHWFRLPRGADYVVSFLLVAPGLLLALPLAPAALRQAGARPAVLAAGLLTAALAGFAILVGGDFMPMGRLLVPALPFAALVWGIGLQRLHDRGHRLLVPALVIAAAALNLPPAFGHHVVPAAVREHFHFRGSLPRAQDDLAVWRQQRDGARSDERLARALARHTQPGESLIRAAVGVLGYRSHLRILDSFALVTRRPAADHMVVPEANPGHDRHLPWPVLLDEQPTYVFAHLAAPGEPIVYGLLGGPFEGSALADLVDVLRFPIEPEPGDTSPLELRLLRFRRWDPPTDAMAALLSAGAGIEPAATDAVARLDAALPPGPGRAAQDALLRGLLADGRIAQHCAGSLRFSRAAPATPRTHDLAVEVTLQSEAGLPMDLPDGKLVYALPIAGEPRLAGQRSGWLAVPPSRGHVDRVEGGTMLLVHLIPRGAVQFAR